MTKWLLLIQLMNQDFVPVDYYEHENQCLMTLHQYRLGETVNKLDEQMVGGGCIPCHEFPEVCDRDI